MEGPSSCGPSIVSGWLQGKPLGFGVVHSKLSRREDGLWTFSRSSTFLGFMRCAASRRRPTRCSFRGRRCASRWRGWHRRWGSRCSRTGATCFSPRPAADLLFSASRPVLSAFAQMEAELNLGKLKSQGIVRFGQSVEASDVMTSGEMRQVIDFSSTSELVTKGMRFTEANCVELRQQILEGDLDYASLIATVVNESLFDYDTAIGGTHPHRRPY